MLWVDFPNIDNICRTEEISNAPFYSMFTKSEVGMLTNVKICEKFLYPKLWNNKTI